jgi:TRAP-type C4-dicarboxylate transport system permease small subunit
MSDGPPANGPFGHGIDRLCRFSAWLGGVLLIFMATMTLVSVAGRALFSNPIQGDVEFVQLCGAICVASFLPYTQWRGGNIIVDFFTSGATPRTRSRLDAFGCLLVGLVLALVSWRTAAGSAAVYQAQETSMLMGIPLWIPYMLMVPGLALTAVAAFYMAWNKYNEKAGT